MEYIETFIDSEFLLWFHLNKPDDNLESIVGLDLYDIWKKYYLFIKNNNSLVKLKIDEEDSKKITSTSDYNLALFKHLINSYLSGDCNVEIVKNLQPLIDEKPFVKLQTTSNLCCDPSIAFPVNTTSFFDEWDKITENSNTKSIAKKFTTDNHLNNWNDLKNDIFQSNAFIITDRYLFSYYKAFDQNFKKLLSLFLPQNKNVNFHLLIITTSIKDINNIYERLDYFLHREKGFKNADVTIIRANIDDEHDRRIYTNLQVLKSSNSFNYFDENGQTVLKHTATLDIHNLISKNKKELFIGFFNPFLRHVKDIVNNVKEHDYRGSKKCRLLSLLDDENTNEIKEVLI